MTPDGWVPVHLTVVRGDREVVLYAVVTEGNSIREVRAVGRTEKQAHTRLMAMLEEFGEVRDDASPKLHGIRRDIHSSERQIHQTIEGLLGDQGIRRYLQYPNHTFHGDRLVLPLRTEYRGRVPGIVHRVSDSGATLYVEPTPIVELNNHISNLRSAEQEEIGRLLWELSQEIHLNGREIHRTLDTLAVLEAFLLVIPQELAKGNIVELGELGSFRLTALASGEDSPEEVSKRNIKEVKVRFKPGKLFKQVLKGLEFRKV